tara:strand:- start:43 stop:837 length:795 start_codon:yes stop_codon:yes gene_type:complete
MAIEEFDGYLNKPSLIRSLMNRFFPEGNLQDIIKTSTGPEDYNIRATKDMVENVNLGPFNLAKDIAAPALAGIFSLPYDRFQAANRVTENDINTAMNTAGMFGPKDIAAEAYGTAYARERPLNALMERFIGASGPLANRFSNNYGFTPTFSGPQGIFAQGANFFKDRFNNNANAQGIDSLIIPNAPGSGYQAGASQYTRPAGTSQPGSGYTPDPSNYNSQPRPAGTSQPGSGYQAGASQYTKSTSKPKGGQISKKSTSYKNKAR